MSNVEQTLSIIKPDAVERNLSEKIKSIFKKNNLNIKEHKKIHITKEEEGYRIFMRFINQSPFMMRCALICPLDQIIVMILEGENAILLNRKTHGSRPI